MQIGKRFFFLLLPLCLYGARLHAAVIGTEFTYQGRLNTGSNAASGLFDLRIALFDAPVAGNGIGERLDLLAVPVTNGLFTVSLDFGPDAFDGSPRWLQLAVKTNGAASLVTLSPRQPLQATPHASYARGAATAATVPNNAITAAKIADSAVTSAKIAPGAVKPSNIDDGGAAGYAAAQEAAKWLTSGGTLPFSALSLISSNSGVAPSLAFTVDGAPAGTVVSFAGDEALSAPYQFVVEVSLPAASLNMEAQLGRQGRLTLTRNGRTTAFTGVVTACALGSSAGANALYSFRLESPLAYMALLKGYGVFQNVSVPVLAQSVFLNTTSNSLALGLTMSYAQRSSIIQFAETSLNFFHRLLEDEGIFYFFRQGAAAPVLTLADDSSAYQNAPNSPFTYYGNQATNVPAGAEYLRTFRNAARESTLTARVNSYDFKRPQLNLNTSEASALGTRGEEYEFGFTRITTPEIQAIVKRRAGRFDVEHSTMFGSGNAPDLRPGYVFTLNDQSGAGVDGAYVITSVRHAAYRRVTNGVVSLYYGNEFEVIPAALGYIPARRTSKPEARPSTAVVTGPAGEEIHTDEYGRVKVQFHWDVAGSLDDRSSAWIRVASPWSGSGWGAIFIPRVGQEVLVNFVDGDPDQPVIIGNLYNGLNVPPYRLPASKAMSGIRTQSTKGGTGSTYNEIRFDDTKGQEELRIAAEKDLNIEVGNDATFSANRLSVSIADVATVSLAALQLSAPQGVAIGGVISAATFQGSGVGLSNVPAASLTGSISDARLSANVARLDTTQTFGGANSFLGSVGVGGVAGADALNIFGDARLNNRDLFLRHGTDTNHGLGWYGLTKLFGGVNVDGPVLYGCDGGGLGTVCSSAKLALRWRVDGDVAIDPQNANSGGLTPGLTFGGNGSEGIASKRSAGGNGFGLDLYTSNRVRVAISAAGNVGIGKTNPAVLLDVAGPIRATGAIRLGSEIGGAPGYPSGSDGLVIRRARSTTSAAGSVVARTDKLTLERDGTIAGLRLSYGASPGYQVIHCTGITTNNTQVIFRRALANPGTAGSLAIFSDTQKIVHYDISFGDTYSSSPAHTTHVVLDRYDDASISDNFLVGTITSTYNQ